MPAGIIRESDPFGSRLVRPVLEGERLVTYQLELLIRHPLPNLLPCSLRSRQGQYQLCLDTTGCKQLEQILSRQKPDYQKSMLILQSIVNSLLNAAEVLLPESQFLLNLADIYLADNSHENSALRLAFLPVAVTGIPERSVGQDLANIALGLGLPQTSADELSRLYAEFGLNGLRSDLNKSVDQHGARKGSESSQRSYYSLSAILLKIDNTFQHWISTIWNWLCGADLDKPVPEENQTIQLAANPADYRMALLSEGRPGTPEENEGLRAFILTDEFLIGRDMKSCDLSLPSQGIGRCHARILRRAGSFFITDLGSRNGTRVNDQRLLKNKEILLPEQCIIQFADQVFHFQVD